MVTVGMSEVDLGRGRTQRHCAGPRPAAGSLLGLHAPARPRLRMAEAEIWGLNPALKSVSASNSSGASPHQCLWVSFFSQKMGESSQVIRRVVRIV